MLQVSPPTTGTKCCWISWNGAIIIILILVIFYHLWDSFLQCYLDQAFAILMQILCDEMHLHTFSYMPEQLFHSCVSPWHEVCSVCWYLGQDVAVRSACKSVLRFFFLCHFSWIKCHCRCLLFFANFWLVRHPGLSEHNNKHMFQNNFYFYYCIILKAVLIDHWRNKFVNMENVKVKLLFSTVLKTLWMVLELTV